MADKSLRPPVRLRIGPPLGSRVKMDLFPQPQSESLAMPMQLSCLIVDAVEANRQELAGVLLQHGVNLVAQLSSCDQVPAMLARPDAPQLDLCRHGVLVPPRERPGDVA